MKRIEYHPVHGTVTVYEIPSNCCNPSIPAAATCKAPNPSYPDCDCRWCVHNKEFNQAKETKNSHFEDEEA